MSELQPAVQATAEKLRSYWSIVGRSYWRGFMTRVATFWVLVILFLTVFVPFIANDAPYSALLEKLDAQGNVIKDAAGQSIWIHSYPLFHNLTREDLIWLLWGFGAIIGAIVMWRTGKKPMEIETRRVLRWRWMGSIIGSAILLSIIIAVFYTSYLDSRDYHKLANSGGIRNAIYAPLRWSFDYQESRTFSPPSPDHIMGTDLNGRDELSRLLWGTRVILEIGLVSEIISLAIGTFYGALMGYFAGKVDIIGMRFLEVVEAIPLLFLLITFIAVFGRQLFMIMVIIGVTGWTGIARFVRAEFLRMRQMDYVSAAKAMGLPLKNILFRHMLPNGLTPVIVTFTFGVAGNIVSESILSFLGIGVVEPTSSWGSMLEQAGSLGIQFRWWVAIPPGLLIFVTVFAYNIMGEALRDAIDPKTNKIV